MTIDPPNPYTWKLAVWLLVLWNPLTVLGYTRVAFYEDFLEPSPHPR